MSIKLENVKDPRLRQRLFDAMLPTTAEAHNAPQVGHSSSKVWEGRVAEIVFSKTPPAKRIRQSSKPTMNKLETEWFYALQKTNPGARPQALKFKLGNGIAYKPDFVDLTARPTTAWEVKGPHAFRGGFENLKVAAALYPEVRWVLVWKDGGQWKQQEVIP